MRVLIVGSGGREHALAWKAAQSPAVTELWVAPGNAGTAALGRPGGNVPIAAEDIAGLLAFARREQIELTIVGPEAPLAAGLVDAFAAAGLAAFGPSRAAAQLEASKAFAKAFMARHGIPTARHAVFSSLQPALDYVRQAPYPLVIKASGLAGGKGVLLPADADEAEIVLRKMMQERVFGAAGDAVVIEERLSGPEVSVMAFCDGRNVALLPPAQDHKRAQDGDRGPNTGGMGAFAPSPLADARLLARVRREIIEPAVAGMHAEGVSYVGVLYAGLMLTADGPKVLEFNCRLGDPETQAVLPLLESDLIEICQACLAGRLHPPAPRLQGEREVGPLLRWRQGAVVSVVLASAGYPGSYAKGRPISGLDEAAALSGVLVFHAGTARLGESVVTAGGRVLNVTAVDEDVPAAARRAYAAIERIHFDGMYYRRDIGVGAGTQ